MKIRSILSLVVLFIINYSCGKDDPCKESDLKATVYKDATYGGVSQTFGIGIYFVDSLKIVGNDQISSMRLSSPACMKVTLCEHADVNNPGICKEFTSDQVFLDNLNDKVSYIKVEKR